MKEDINQMMINLEKEHKFGDELIKRWNQLNPKLTYDEKIETIQWMTNRGFIFGWLDLICYLLPNISESPVFLEVTLSIAHKVKRDLAQGPFINMLIEVGEKNPKLAQEYYSLIIEKHPDLFGYAGLLLGGAARSDSIIYNELIKNVFISDGPKCASYLRAIRVYQERLNEIDNKIFPLLKILKEKQDIEIENEVMLAYFDFYNYNKEEVVASLLEFAEMKTVPIQYILANQLLTRKIDINDTCKLLCLLSTSSESKVLEQVAMVLALKCKSKTEYSLSIIKKWIDSGKFFDLNNIYWVLEEIGQENLDQSLEIIKSWFGKRYLPLYSGSIFWAIGKKDPKKTISFLTELLIDDTLRPYVLKELRAILDKLYEINKEGGDIVDSCYDSLYHFADTQGLHPEKIVKKETNKIFQCCAIIEELEKPKINVDFKIIFSKLAHYKGIKNFFSEKWFIEKQKKNDPDHPLLYLLSKNELNSWDKAFLVYLDENVSNLKNNMSGIGEIRNGLKASEHFWHTISELDILLKLMAKYDVSIAPKINLLQNDGLKNRKPDFEVNIGSNEVLIEVITPQIFSELYYFGSAGVPQHLGSKVYHEFNRHFKGQLIEKDIIIAINIENSEINYDSAEDYLEGTYQVTLQMDKITKKVISVFPSRADDSMIKLDPDTKCIIGLILYRKTIGNDKKLHFKGRVFPNRTVLNKERQNILDEIKKIIMG